MSTYNYAPGALHFDIHHNNIAVSVPQIMDLVRSFVPEDITTDSVSSSSAATNESQSKLFPCITKAAYDAGKAESVNDELRSASVSAPKLVKALNLNEALGYVDTKNMSSKDLYDLLDDCYELKFGPRNFSLYRSK